MSLTTIPVKSQTLNNLSPDKEKNFPTFLLTPNVTEPDSAFKKALVAPQSPGHAVCQSIPHYIQSKNGYDAGKVYKESPCIKKGFGFEELLLSFLAGAALAVAADEIFWHSH
jgi:hypothetical protein